ncbi:head-tail connector protein [Paraburkholderia atlantica]|uniref:head-tail connector protein n=1 Tax=Paraburkholderia atlantica TaxID=2654982 RepID=UPI000370CA75|nr:head-tail connector protein [Paraburkholderia atlantica]
MTELITTADALAHLRADAGAEDDLIAIYLGAAVDAAQNYCNRQFFATDEEMTAAVTAGTAGDDPIVITDSIRSAILLILGKLYSNREDVVTGTGRTVQKLPDGSQYLLQPYRVGMGV